MVVLKQDKYLESAQTANEKRREEYLKTQNANYRTFVQALKTLEKMKKDKTFEARSKRLGKLISAIRGAGSPQVKLERILFSFRKLREQDYIVADIKDAENKKISAEDVQSRMKSALFDEEVKSTAHASIFTINQSMKEVQKNKALDALAEYFNPPPTIEYEEVVTGEEKISKVAVITLDDTDVDNITEYMNDSFGEYLTDLTEQDHEIKTNLYEILLELYVDSFGEYPTFYVKQSGDIAGYIKSLKSQVFRQLQRRDKGSSEKKPIGGKIISKDSLDTAFDGIEGEIRLLNERKKELDNQIVQHEDIDIEKEMANYQNRIDEEISEIKSELKEFKERFDSTKTKLKSLKDKETSLGQLSATEYVEGKKELDPEIKEANRVLDVIIIQGDKLKEKLAILQKADSTSIRSAVESSLMEEYQTQVDNIKELDSRIIKLKQEITLPKPVKKEIKKIIRRFDPSKELEGEMYREYLTAFNTYERILMRVGRKIDLEITQMKSYIKKNSEALQNTADYFIGLTEKEFSVENPDEFEDFAIVLAMNKHSLTDSDMSELQVDIIEALKLRRKIISLTNKAKEKRDAR